MSTRSKRFRLNKQQSGGIQSLRETRLYSNTLLRRFCERVTRDGIDCIGLRYICHSIKITTFEKFVLYFTITGAFKTKFTTSGTFGRDKRDIA